MGPRLLLPWSQPRSPKESQDSSAQPTGCPCTWRPEAWSSSLGSLCSPQPSSPSHEALVGSCVTIHRDPSLSEEGVDPGVLHPHMSSQSLGLEHGSGPLWDFHELMLHGPAAGMLGCRSAGGLLCGHFPASGPCVSVHTMAPPTDGVAVSPTPTVTVQGTARPEAAPSAIQVTHGSCTPRWAKAEATGGITGHPFLAVTLLLAAISKKAWLAPLLA